MPVIHFTIGEFDKIARAYPVFISLPGLATPDDVLRLAPLAAAFR